MTKFVNTRTIKEVLISVKNELPKLLGYKHSNLFLLDETGLNIQAVGLDEEADKNEREQY